MTTPNYPYGEPNNNDGSHTGSGGDVPDYTAHGTGSSATSNSPGAPGYYPGGSASTHNAGYQDPYGAPQYDGGFENSPLNQGRNKLASWALGLGIASVVLYVLVVVPFLSVVAIFAPLVGLIGLIVSIVALVKRNKFVGAARRTGFSVTGLILSILSLVIFAILVVLLLVVLGSGVMDCFSGDYPDQASQQACVEQALNDF